MLEAIRDDDKPDLASTDKNLVEMKLLPVSLSDVYIVKSHVHGVLGLHEVSAIELT